MTAPAPLPAVDRGERAADAAVVLVLASVAMFFASLYSGFVLLRVGSESWPAPWIAAGTRAAVEPWLRLLWLLVAIAAARAGAHDAAGSSPLSRSPLHLGTAAGLTFAAHTVVAGRSLTALGHTPASHVAVATWFALNGVLALLVVAGAAASSWAALTLAPDLRRRRARAMARYWTLLAICFLAVLAGMYLA
jgi:heme/copper-type cytochrome/quinol oxidase subunit 3